MTAKSVIRAIQKKADPIRARHSLRFFKTEKGEYGEGDAFLGLTMPEQRTIARDFSALPLTEIQKLLNSPFHEHRMVGLIILTLQYPTSDEAQRHRIYSFYLKNAKNINNWDLVDVTTPRIVGAHLLKRDKSVLYTLAKSNILWKRRIAILATAYFIRKRRLKDAFSLAKVLLHDKQDLMHKAVGWMLREAGKVDKNQLVRFLRAHGSRMPRTMLRYAIEKFPEKERKAFLSKTR